MINLGPYSGADMQNIYIRGTWADRILEAIAVLLSISMWVLAILWSGKTPGNPRDWFAIAIGSTVITGLLFWSAYAPIRFIRFPVRLTKQNVWWQYRIATKYVRVVNIIINGILLSSALPKLRYGLEPEIVQLVTFGGIAAFILSLIGYYLVAFRYR